MSTPRDQVLAARAETIARAKARGVNVEDIAREDRDPRTVDTQLLQTLNGGMPTVGRGTLQTDLPPRGTFDGVNVDFTLSRQPIGLKLKVLFCVQGTGTLTELARSSNTAPPPGSFYFDGNVAIRVGVPPQVNDNLAAVYVSAG